MAAPIALWGPKTIGGTITLMTAAANVQTIVTRAVFTNTDSSAHNLNVWVVRKGQTQGNSNLVIDALPVSPSVPYVASPLGNLVLNSGDQIQASGDLINTVGSGFTW